MYVMSTDGDDGAGQSSSMLSSLVLLEAEATGW